MGYFRPERLPDDADVRQAKRDARTILDAAVAQLRGPGLLSPGMVEALTGVMEDERLAPRPRRRAAELLLKARLGALDVLGGLRPGT